MNKSSYSSKVFTVLDHKLTKLDQLKHEKDLLAKDSSFTRRKKKLDFKEDMKILMPIGSSSMKKELYEYFDYDIDTVSLPGFIRSRAKIKEEAFIELLKMINKAYPCKKTYKGYRLLAADGCELSVFTDPDDHDTYKDQSNTKGCSSLHIRVCGYRCCNRS